MGGDGDFMLLHHLLKKGHTVAYFEGLSPLERYAHYASMILEREEVR